MVVGGLGLRGRGATDGPDKRRLGQAQGPEEDLDPPRGRKAVGKLEVEAQAREDPAADLVDARLLRVRDVAAKPVGLTGLAG